MKYIFIYRIGRKLDENCVVYNDKRVFRENENVNKPFNTLSDTMWNAW